MASSLLPGSRPLWTAALSNCLFSSQVPIQNSSAWTTAENPISNNTSIVACVSVAAGMCLPSRCLETNVVSEPFANNGCFCGSTVLSLSNYATTLYLFTRKQHWRDDCTSSSEHFVSDSISVLKIAFCIEPLCMFNVYLKETWGMQFTFIGSRGGKSVFKTMFANLGYPTICKPKTEVLISW
jgi:hypothetical protein